MVPITGISKSPKHHFFGYYDKCPWSPDEKLLLTMETDLNNHFPHGERAGIGIIDLENKYKISIVSHTRAWNWQQGAMLQWHPSLSDTILFNDCIEKQFVCIQYNITTGNRKILPQPVAAVNHSGTSALSLNYARLYNVRRDYGYEGVSDPWRKNLYPEEDGIYSLDLRTGVHRLLISTHQISNYEPQSSLRGVRHWINHIAYNMDDSRFCFLHRYEIPRLNRFGTRLFTANVDGSDLRCLWNSHVSHFDWRDRNHILAWAVHQKALSKTSRAKELGVALLKQNTGLYKRLKMLPFLRARLYGGAFFLFNDTETEENTYKIVGKGVLTEDGHCSYSPNKKWILMDTYPDIHNHRHILLYSIKTGSCIDVGSFFSPPTSRNELRCDLHARWDRTGKQVCFDSMHEGSRQMYILDVSGIVKEFGKH